jgi:predicted nucleic acid-binding protein
LSVFYLDASALVKLVLVEAESDALRTYIAGADLLSSELVLTEVPRAIRRVVSDRAVPRLRSALDQASAVLGRLALRPLDRPVLAAAGAIDLPPLRALDAIHVATAADLGPIDAFVTYDERQAAAARLAGLRTTAPGARIAGL